MNGAQGHDRRNNRGFNLHPAIRQNVGVLYNWCQLVFSEVVSWADARCYNEREREMWNTWGFDQLGWLEKERGKPSFSPHVLWKSKKHNLQPAWFAEESSTFHLPFFAQNRNKSGAKKSTSFLFPGGQLLRCDLKVFTASRRGQSWSGSSSNRGRMGGRQNRKFARGQQLLKWILYIMISWYGIWNIEINQCQKQINLSNKNGCNQVSCPSLSSTYSLTRTSRDVGILGHMSNIQLHCYSVSNFEWMIWRCGGIEEKS